MNVLDSRNLNCANHSMSETARMYDVKATLELLKKKTINVSPNCGPAKRCRLPINQAATAPVRDMQMRVKDTKAASIAGKPCCHRISAYLNGTKIFSDNPERQRRRQRHLQMRYTMCFHATSRRGAQAPYMRRLLGKTVLFRGSPASSATVARLRHVLG